MIRFIVLTVLFFVILIGVTHYFPKIRMRSPKKRDAYLGFVAASLIVYIASGIGADGRAAREEANREATKAMRAERQAADARAREPIDGCGGDGSGNPSDWRWSETEPRYTTRVARNMSKTWSIQFAGDRAASRECIGELGTHIRDGKDRNGRVACPHKAPIWPREHGAQKVVLNKVLANIGLPPSSGLQPRPDPNPNSQTIRDQQFRDPSYSLGLWVEVDRQRLGTVWSDCWLLTRVTIALPGR